MFDSFASPHGTFLHEDVAYSDPCKVWVTTSFFKCAYCCLQGELCNLRSVLTEKEKSFDVRIKTSFGNKRRHIKAVYRQHYSVNNPLIFCVFYIIIMKIREISKEWVQDAQGLGE